MEQQQPLQQKIDQLQEELEVFKTTERLRRRWKTLDAKLSRLEHMKMLEDRPDIKHQLEDEISDIETELNQIEQQLDDLENQCDQFLQETQQMEEDETIYYLDEVFKESGIPKVTFVEPANFNKLMKALKQEGRGIIIEGPPGIGKTTALNEAIRQLKAGGYKNNLEILSALSPENVERLKNIKQWHTGIVAIDDFHYLDNVLKESLIEHLKYLANIASDEKLVIAGTPLTGKKLVEVGYNLIGKIDIITMRKRAEEFIHQMLEKAELALNIKFAGKDEIVKAANGSLNIAQMLVKRLTDYDGIKSTQKKTKRVHHNLEKAIEDVRMTIYPKYKDFICSFALLGGKNDHTCIRLLEKLAESEEGYLSLDDQPGLTRGIQKFISENYTEILSKKYPQYEQYLFYDKHTRVLAIDDPKLIFYLSHTPKSQLREEVGISKSSSNRVFISYSRKDKKRLEELREYLQCLKSTGIIEDYWDDTKIKAGEKWREEIEKALNSAKVAILLVSSAFFASEFIQLNELAPILSAAEKEGLTIIYIILNPCQAAFYHSELNHIQAVNPPDKPLSKIGKNGREEIYDKVADAIIEALDLGLP